MVSRGDFFMFNVNDKIMPVEEILNEDEFTGRVEILRDLEHWISEIGRVGAGSTSIIAPRRMGKTVLLDRLVNIVFYKPENKVAPIYIKFKREEITLRKFLLVYATEFFRQYIAYCLQDPILYSRTDTELDELLEIKSDDKATKLAQQYIGFFLKRYNRNTYEDSRNHWDEFIKVPEQIAAHSGIRVAIIIDEFQDMKFYVYDNDDEGLARWKDKAKGNPSYAAVDLTATFDRMALSKKAPMLVSGSAVTLIFKTVMGGPLGGRFGFRYLRTLSIDDGATLILNLIKIYLPNETLSEENAIYSSTQVDGHPYYLYCIITSDFEGKKFDSQQDIDEILEYELQQGKIYGFWQTHFDENREVINNDNDKDIGKKIIYYFTRYSDREVDIAEIAKEIGINREIVEEKIKKLYEGDLVYKTKARFYAFRDICLMRYIKFAYEIDLEDVKPIDLSEKGRYSILKGHFLELVVQQVMSKFNGEVLEGKYFGQEKTVTASRFLIADTRYAKGEKTDLFQIDVFGRLQGKEKVWLCECKYKNTKMNLEEVKKLEKAREAYLKQEEGEDRVPPKTHLWYVSTGGFTKEALEYLKDKENTYFSDYDSINAIFKAYGGGFKIPIFIKE